MHKFENLGTCRDLSQPVFLLQSVTLPILYFISELALTEYLSSYFIRHLFFTQTAYSCMVLEVLEPPTLLTFCNLTKSLESNASSFNAHQSRNPFSSFHLAL